MAIAEFPDQVENSLPPLAKVLPPPLPNLVPTKTAYWLEQNWSLEDRHWFHHVARVPRLSRALCLVRRAGASRALHLFGPACWDSHYLERFGFIPSPQTIHTDETTLRRFGYANVFETTPAPPSLRLVVDASQNVDGARSDWRG